MVLKALPARAIPVVPTDQAARVVPEEGRAELVVLEDQAVRAVPEGKAEPVVLEDQAARVVPVVEATQEVPGAPEVDRVDPGVVQAARVAQEVPEEDQVDPAGIGDPAVSACGLPGINN